MDAAQRAQIRVVLVDARNPLNIGAAARAMVNFGFDTLRLVNPYPVAFQEARSAVRAVGVLKTAEQCGTVAEAVADCALVAGTSDSERRELKHPLRRLENGARTIAKAAASGPVALLFGSEKFGLSNDDLSHCHWLMRIPTLAEQPSMNLGQAVAVTLYELVRSREAARARPAERRAAVAAESERITQMLVEVLKQSGYVNPVIGASTLAKTRRLVRRLNLESADVAVLSGMLRQILWKLNSR
jgi:TrmH family RNA methyltransferase